MDKSFKKSFRRVISSILISFLCFYFFLVTIRPAYSGKAGEFTGSDFLHYCVTTDPDAEAGDRYEQDMVVYCNGYMEAVVTLVLIMSGKEVCLPENATPKDIYGATLKFLRQHPEREALRLAGTALTAVMMKWPCK